MKKHIVAKTVLLLSFAAILVVGVFVSMQGVLVPQYAEAATCPVSSVTPAIGNQAAWDSKFSARYGTGGVPDLSSGAETPAQRAEKFSWQGHYWVRAYVSMAKTYGDTKYLDKAVSSIDNWFAYQETSQGWGASINPSQMFLDTGVIAQAITVFSYEVWNDSRFTAYRPKADSYIAKLEPILHTYDAQWANNVTAYNGSPSFYVYSTCGADGKSVCSAASLVMYNQGATMVKALLLIDRIKRLKGQTPDAGYLDKANKGAAYFKTFARLNGTAYVWDYGGARGSGIEDTSHGHLDLSHLVWAYQFGLGGLTSTDMARLAGTARVILSSAGANDVSTRVDGTGLAGTNDYERVSIGYDWIDLVDYDQTLLDKVINVFNAHMSAPSSARFFFGWAEILRKKNCVSLYDSVVGTPAPTPTPTPTLPPVLSVSPTSLSFGNVVVGTQSTAKTLTITNTGTGPLSFTSTFTFTGDFTGLGTCSTATPLAVGGSCVLNMTFTPTAIGTRTGTVTMTTNDANSPKIIAFSGTGVTSPTPTPVFDVTPSFSTSAATLSIDLTPPYQNQLNWSYTDVPNPSTSFVRFTNVTKGTVYNFAIPLGTTQTNTSLRAGFSGGVRTGEQWKGEIISSGTIVASTNVTIGTTPGGTTISAYTQIQGESYSAMQGIQNNGTTISDLDTTDWVSYTNRSTRCLPGVHWG